MDCRLKFFTNIGGCEFEEEAQVFVFFSRRPSNAVKKKAPLIKPCKSTFSFHLFFFKYKESGVVLFHLRFNDEFFCFY